MKEDVITGEHGTPQAGKGEKLRYLQEFSVQYGDA